VEKMYVPILLMSSTIVFVLCDALAANWGKSKSTASLLLVVLVSPLCYILFGIINKHKSLATSAAVINMLALVGTILVGVIVFREGLTLRQMVGISFAFFAIFLLR
jgi:multidrug transporter EmrE-like cation transporter